MKKSITVLLLVAAWCAAMPLSAHADEMQESFLRDLSEGLAERWSYDQDEDAMTRSEILEYRSKLVTAETSRLDKYTDEVFENEKFNLIAHAYIEAVDNQLSALKYFEELENIYALEWSAGYDVRAALLPILVDSYGLVADEEEMQDFRNGNAYTVSLDETPTVPTVQNPEEEFVVYNNEGITIYVTGYSEDSYSKNINFRIENLNHHDIIVQTSDYRVILNGNMVNSSLYEEVKSGKTAVGSLSFYSEDPDMVGIDTLEYVTFSIAILDPDTYSTLYTSDEISLSIDEENAKVSARMVYNDTETIRQVQELLNSAGYDCGAADGVSGKKTNSAILQFERDHNLPENTDLTPELLETLKAAIQ